MRAYKCDRCGEFFEKDEEIRINKMFYRIDYYNNITGGRTINLCESCKQSFIDWFTECKEKTND